VAANTTKNAVDVNAQALGGGSAGTAGKKLQTQFSL